MEEKDVNMARGDQVNGSDKDAPPVLFSVAPLGPHGPWAFNTITGIMLIIPYKTSFQELYNLPEAWFYSLKRKVNIYQF